MYPRGFYDYAAQQLARPDGPQPRRTRGGQSPDPQGRSGASGLLVVAASIGAMTTLICLVLA